MLLPESVNRVQYDVALQAFDRRGLFMARLAFVCCLDLLDQKLRVFVNCAHLELRFFLRQTERESRVHPMHEARVIGLIDVEILFHFRRHGFVDHLVDKFARFFGIDHFIPIGVNHLTLHVHHVVEVQRAFAD